MILFEAAFAELADVRVFAGAGKSQRLVGPAGEMLRSKGLLALNLDGLPVESKQDGGRSLFVYLSAQNPRGPPGSRSRSRWSR